MKTQQALKYIRSYKRKYKEGFTEGEVAEVLNHIGIDQTRFYAILGCCTMMIKDGNTLLYPYDMEVGISAYLENRELYGYEFD